MIRILFIARYRDETMDRQIALLVEQGDLTIRQVRPRFWQDDLIRVEQTDRSRPSWQQVAAPMIGHPSDPHRALYRTVDFGMRRFRPHLIYAVEEPDSLSGLQIALARRLFAPRARLLLYTWQNINRPRPVYVNWVAAVTRRAADGILCANSEAAAILARHAYRGRTWVIPAIGVDTQTFTPCPARPPNPRLVVGYAGRLVAEKGLETLIEAVAQLGQDAELALIGGGPHLPALQAAARAAGLGERVQFRPPVPPAQLARQLCELDVLALPSRTTRVWKEQFGRVLTEAMACRVPVIGSDSGAIPEVIGDAGLIFPEGDAAALADRLRQLIASPALRRELAERGVERVQRAYTQEHIAGQIAAVYREMLE